MTTHQPAARPAPHPTQVRLPGQAAAPDGPLDLTMMFVVHRAFRRDLENFAAAAARTPLDDGASWLALDERWQLFAAALHHHHTSRTTGSGRRSTRRRGPPASTTRLSCSPRWLPSTP